MVASLRVIVGHLKDGRFKVPRSCLPSLHRRALKLSPHKDFSLFTTLKKDEAVEPSQKNGQFFTLLIKCEHLGCQRKVRLSEQNFSEINVLIF